MTSSGASVVGSLKKELFCGFPNSWRNNFLSPKNKYPPARIRGDIFFTEIFLVFTLPTGPERLKQRHEIIHGHFRYTKSWVWRGIGPQGFIISYTLKDQEVIFFHLYLMFSTGYYVNIPFQSSVADPVGFCIRIRPSRKNRIRILPARKKTDMEPTLEKNRIRPPPPQKKRTMSGFGS